MQQNQPAYLLLEDGTLFKGIAIGKIGTTGGEIAFNTGMTGYQEVFTDPSYYGQLLIMTTAHIGNYGTQSNEQESDKINISGLITKKFSDGFSRTSGDQSLQDFMVHHETVGISDIDTRALVSYIRENGAMNAVITTDVDDIGSLSKKLAEVPSMEGLELASKVSTKATYYYGNENSKFKVAALDLGIKKNILRNLAKRDVYIKVFPFNSSFEEMKEWNPDGYFLSNGPGDPEPLKGAQDVAKKIIDQNLPLFGICLGHQIIALANGISTYKMHNGHRGINHPVKNLITGKGEITSQNHGFAVNKEESLANENVEITHVHLNDDTVAGIKLKDSNCFSVQFHPEASPGPHDSSYLFDEFIENMSK